MTRRGKRVAVAGALLAAIVFVGCGDDDDEGGGGTATSAAATLACQTVAFTPNSEDAASSVTATGLSCAEAEAFVRAAGSRTSSGGPPQVTVNGYRCVLTKSVRDPLPQASYECTNDGKKVTFIRT